MSLPELATSAAAGGILAATWLNAALRPGSQLLGKTLVAGHDPSEVALTFDDGPNDPCTEQLLQVLADHNVRATFFLIGRFVQQRRALARRVHEAGHLVGNHTVHHPWLAWQSARRIHDELRGCNALIEDAIGAPVRFFRPPHGARRPAVLRQAAELGLITVQWNVTGFDWEPISGEQIADRVRAGADRARQRKSSANILLHDGFDGAMGADRSQTIRATGLLIPHFRETGRRLMTVDAWASAQ